jgi:hypothetical protein
LTGEPAARPRSLYSAYNGPTRRLSILNAGASISGAGQDQEARAMSDVLMIGTGVGFFVASILYVLACERM